MLFFVPSSIGSCCFLLLVAYLLGVSACREEREREIELEEMGDGALDRDA